jgi:SAM-dependent methyltransferase
VWDESLYAGSTPHYVVGCGPGPLTLLLAPLFAEAVGVDADGGMVAEAARSASAAGVTNVRLGALGCHHASWRARRPAAAAAGAAVGRHRRPDHPLPGAGAPRWAGNAADRMPAFEADLRALLDGARLTAPAAPR